MLNLPNELVLEILSWLTNKEMILFESYFGVRANLRLETKLDLTEFTNLQKNNLCRQVNLISTKTSASVIMINKEIKVFGKIPADEYEYFELAPLINKFTNVKSISVGLRHVLALTHDNKLFGIGSDLDNQIGSKDVFVSEPELMYSDISRAVAGYEYSLIQMYDEIHFFGYLYDDFEEINCNLEDEIIKIAAGDQNIIVLTDKKELYGFGRSEYNEVGPESNRFQLIETEVDDVVMGYFPFFVKNNKLHLRNVGEYVFTIPNKIIQIESGNWHCLILDDKGCVYVVGTSTSEDTELEPILNNIVQIATGSEHSLALDRDGMLWGFGSNKYGQLVIEEVNIDKFKPIIKLF